MCTLVLLRRPGTDWPLMLAANRDELAGRPWLPPARHWADDLREDVIAGLDQLAGGTWLGINDRAMVAGVLNRYGTLGPAPGKRSRGELPLEALDHESAEAAAEALAELDGRAYRPFNMLVADVQHAFWLALREGETRIHVHPIDEGLHMLTAHDLDDTANSARIRHFRPLFMAAAPPDPAAGDWSAWETLLASKEGAPESGAEGAMDIDIPLESKDNSDGTPARFATSSSSLIALARPAQPPVAPVWRFCHGAPSTGRWTDIPTTPLSDTD